ncbi:MAG TPA: ornithine carbamoyltransferase, partial [Miltoncostaeaceae bacterium]|nr:ornithine carbamoyltransferase [Miltoncostaeaceae bacterium]
DPALAGRSVLTLRHHPPEAVAAVLDLADELKAIPGASWPPLLAGRVIALIFERPSTRTRVSFAAGIARLGGTGLVLSAGDLQLGRGETIEDTAKVMGRWVDAIVLRTGPHATIEELDRHAGVPVVNGLTYAHHPCQALADAQTIRERFGALTGLPVAYLGDGNNCCVSLMIVGALTGMRVTAGCPPGYRPDPEIVAWADAAARERGGGARVVEDAREAVAGARVLYTDTWVSMGDEESEAERIAALEPYRVDDALMDAAAPDAVAMHCLPAHHGHEITYEVLHGPRSAAWDQAENRMHAQAALLAHILG